MNLIIALSAFFNILFNKKSADLWTNLMNKEPDEVREVKSAPQEDKLGIKTENTNALYTLVLLQREGRFIDFLKEDISGYKDEQVGAAVRQVHKGCRKVLDEYFTLVPVLKQQEGDSITIQTGFNPNEIDLSGNIKGNAPYKGIIKHKGWKAASINLPVRKKEKDLDIVCPAEVEI